jgi:hypothetical protein
MGYRSDLTILFYAEAKHFDAVTAWVDEHLRPVLQQHYLNEDFRPTEFNRPDFAGYAVHFNGVKWYESYPEVDAVEQVWTEFAKQFNCLNEDALLSGEYIRIGEDYSDVEYRSTYNSMGLIKLVAEF